MNWRTLTCLALSLWGTSASAWIKVTPDFDDEPIIATSFWSAVVTTGPFYVTSDSASASSGADDYRLQLARDYAASFVASDGQIRGVRLEAALQHLRQTANLANKSDLELAQAILTYPDQ